jgi:hypothetical protein
MGPLAASSTIEKRIADDLKQTIFAYPTGASDVGYML